MLAVDKPMTRNVTKTGDTYKDISGKYYFVPFDKSSIIKNLGLLNSTSTQSI